jgi:probable rRNA maturation factor
MILNRQRKVRVARRPLESFLRRAQNELGVPGVGLTVCLVSDLEIARMNESYRKKKGPTDVLSFPAGEGKHGKVQDAVEKYLGDIVIAPETARRYAKKNGRKLSEELRVLILHGLLHLLGYDHETDRGEMNRFETRLKRRFGLA